MYSGLGTRHYYCPNGLPLVTPSVATSTVSPNTCAISSSRSPRIATASSPDAQHCVEPLHFTISQTNASMRRRVPYRPRCIRSVYPVSLHVQSLSSACRPDCPLPAGVTSSFVVISWIGHPAQDYKFASRTRTDSPLPLQSESKPAHSRFPAPPACGQECSPAPRVGARLLRRISGRKRESLSPEKERQSSISLSVCVSLYCPVSWPIPRT
jgi:hypothetical protein